MDIRPMQFLLPSQNLFEWEKPAFCYSGQACLLEEVSLLIASPLIASGQALAVEVAILAIAVIVTALGYLQNHL
jgi:hypothetical protein